MSEEFSSPGSLQPSINPVKSLVSWGILGQSTAMIYFNLRGMNREEWVAPIPGDRLSVLHALVCDAELSKVVANHLGLDFNLGECLAIVYTNDVADHLGNDDHVTQMGIHTLWFPESRCRFLCFAQTLHEFHVFPLQSYSGIVICLVHFVLLYFTSVFLCLFFFLFFILVLFFAS